MKIIALLVVVTALAAGGVYLGQTAQIGRGSLPDDSVALVNGYSITDDYVQRRIEQLPLGSQIEVRENRAKFIETVVTEEALLQSVLANGFAGEAELRGKVKALVAEHLIESRVRNAVEVTPEMVERYYRDNQRVIRGETVVVRHILLASRDECEALMPKIDSDQTFADFAEQKSLDRESAGRGGVLGRVMNHNAWLGFEQEMFQMNDGEMRIFDGSDGGCHLVRAGAREVPPLPPLDQVRERISSLLAREQEIALLRELVGDVERRIVIVRRGPTQ